MEDLNDNSSIPGTVTGLSAAVIWQDEEIIPSTSTQPSLITVDGHQYIEFTISATDIKPGNIVIALRGSIGVLAANSIHWSWQIWVTEKDLHASGGWMPYTAPELTNISFSAPQSRANSSTRLILKSALPFQANGAAQWAIPTLSM